MSRFPPTAPPLSEQNAFSTRGRQGCPLVVSSSSSRPRQFVGLFANAAPAVLAVGLLLVAWELYANYSGIKPTVLPAPSRVFEQAMLNRDALIDNAIPTIRATLIGFA